MPLPGQNFCTNCLKPVRTPGPCDNCLAKEQRIVKAGNYCDHCGTNAMKSLLYLNRKTSKRYCVDCRATFHKQLMIQGIKPEDANKILMKDFILVNDPMKKVKRPKKK
ncbi:MAG: hypothetical protein ACXAE3_06185 [Candidatus Kariarchaeaceae archaeon]